MYKNKFVFLLLFIVANSCEYEKYPIPAIAIELNCEDLYEKLKWETYQTSYLCKATSSMLNKEIPFDGIETSKVDVLLEDHTLKEDTIKFYFSFKHKNQYLIPECHFFKSSYTYLISSKKRIAWNEGGAEFSLRENLQHMEQLIIEEENKVDVNFIHYLQNNSSQVNPWLIYYANKRGFFGEHK